MDVHAVIGDEGVGTTATAVNLAVALRQDGHHAAVLDLTGEVAALLGAPAAGDGGSDGEAGADGGETPAATLADGGSVAAATVDAPLSPAGGETGASDGPGASGGAASVPEDEPGEGSADADRDYRPVDHLPVIVAGERAALASAPPDRRESLRADLAFAYDHVIVDAARPDEDDGVVAFADGLLVVTTPDDDGLRAATDLVRACSAAGGLVVGTVVERAGEGTDAAAVRERTRTEVVGVIPAGDHPPDREPVAHTAPDSPPATAYRRLAATVADWSGESGLVDGGPGAEPERDPDAGGGSDPEAGDGNGEAAPSDDEPASRSDGESGHPLDGDSRDDDTDGTDDEDGGLLSRFF